MSHTPPSPSAQPQRSILKKSSSSSIHGTTTAGQNHLEPTRAKFDEMNVLETLHPSGKDYGHMKIDEPKTPYNYAEGEDHDAHTSASTSGATALDHTCLIKKLAEQAQAGAPPRAVKSLSTLSVHDSDSDEESQNNDPAHKEFISKRKDHYNEFQAIQRARQLIEQEREENGGSSSDEGGSGKSGSSPGPKK